jgi:hypothetical protein
MNTKPRKPISYYKYGKHRNDAKQRNIPFQLTYNEWYNWWLSNGVDKNIKQPLTKNTLCMCRYGDTGPYSLDNIYCATLSQNQKDARSFNPNFGNTRSKPFHTPLKDFPSRLEASRQLGMTIDKLVGLQRKYPSDYYYL